MEELSGPSMSLPNNFNHHICQSDLPILFMVRIFYRSNIPVLFMVENFNSGFLVCSIFLEQFKALVNVIASLVLMAERSRAYV